MALPADLEALLVADVAALLAEIFTARGSEPWPGLADAVIGLVLESLRAATPEEQAALDAVPPEAIRLAVREALPGIIERVLLTPVLDA